MTHLKRCNCRVSHRVPIPSVDVSSLTITDTRSIIVVAPSAVDSEVLIKIDSSGLTRSSIFVVVKSVVLVLLD